MINPAGSADHKTLIVILGPTAVGKTDVGVKLAQYFDTVVLSADSRQFYHEMKIGTALPEPGELQGIKHYFFASRSIKDDYNVSAYEKEALALLKEVFAESNTALMVGGSGLYIDAVTNGIDELPDADMEIREQLRQEYETQGLEPLKRKLESLDPEYYSKMDQSNPNRVMRALEVCMATGDTFSSLRKNCSKEREFSIIKIGLNLPREELFKRIHDRVDEMLLSGLLDEVKKLYPEKELNALKTVGYSELFRYLEGGMALDDAIEKIKTNTRRYAKRQLTWFKRDSDIKWFRPDEVERIIAYLNQMLDAGS